MLRIMDACNTATILARMCTGHDVLNHTLCDMSYILTTRWDKGVYMVAGSRPHPLAVSGCPLIVGKGM